MTTTGTSTAGDNITVSVPSVTAPITPLPQPSVCPGCGRCRYCGQPSVYPYIAGPTWTSVNTIPWSY